MRNSLLTDLPEDILDGLKRLARPQPLISLLNYYKGVPISYEASLRRFDLNTATLSVHKHQAVCLALEGQTCLQSKPLSLAVQASVVAVDVGAGTARLANFRPAAYTTGRRLAVKPNPDQPVEVEILAQNWTVHGRLEAISLVSIGIYLPASEIFFEPVIVLREDADLRLRLRLPGAEEPVELAGTVSYGLPQQSDYALRVKPADEANALKAIQSYILHRHEAAAQELDIVYEQMRHSPPPADPSAPATS